MVDVLVMDSEDRPVLLGEVKDQVGLPLAEDLQLTKYLGAMDSVVPFGMLVDPDSIRFYRWDGEHLSGPVLSTETASILRYYSSYFDEFRTKGIDESYLLTLVKAWLRDLSYQWKSKTSGPPGSKELDDLGLLPLLKDATIGSEVPLGGHHLHRD
jgi:hypothetical protein